MVMARITDHNEAVTAAWRAANGNQQPGDLVEDGYNVVTDEHVLLAGFLPIVVFGSSVDSDGCFAGGYSPFFGDDWYAFVLTDITDRVGPNGEEMPSSIFDEPAPEPEAFARSAASAPSPAPAPKRAKPRSAKELIASLPKAARKKARELARAKGVLGKDEGDDDDDREPHAPHAPKSAREERLEKQTAKNEKRDK